MRVRRDADVRRARSPPGPPRPPCRPRRRRPLPGPGEARPRKGWGDGRILHGLMAPRGWRACQQSCHDRPAFSAHAPSPAGPDPMIRTRNRRRIRPLEQIPSGTVSSRPRLRVRLGVRRSASGISRVSPPRGAECRAASSGDARRGPAPGGRGCGTGKTQVITRRIAWLIATRRPGRRDPRADIHRQGRGGDAALGWTSSFPTATRTRRSRPSTPSVTG